MLKYDIGEMASRTNLEHLGGETFIRLKDVDDNYLQKFRDKIYSEHLMRNLPKRVIKQMKEQPRLLPNLALTRAKTIIKSILPWQEYV